MLKTVPIKLQRSAWDSLATLSKVENSSLPQDSLFVTTPPFPPVVCVSEEKRRGVSIARKTRGVKNRGARGQALP